MQPKIYSQSEHSIKLENLDPDAVIIMEKLRSADYTSYLVGGGVRDLLLGRDPKDYDISTSAEPEEIRSLFRNCILIGKRFRLAHIRFGKKIFEVSTFRAGDNETEDLIVRDNVWGTPEQDVLRRDFTINGLYYDPFSEEVIDYVDGFDDLRKSMLRTIGQPYLRFKQDPVRMLRLIKFQARFGFGVEQDTRQALLECRGEITKSSQARILEEILRMLESGASAKFFRLLNEEGLLSMILPNLSRFLEKKEGSDVFDYLDEIDERNKRKAPPFELRSLFLACLAFPFFQQMIEKETTRLHLGEIFGRAHDLAHDLFTPFLQLPRKLKSSLASILCSQYRLTPLDSKKRKKRIPDDPDFLLALKFFEVRTCIEPGLKDLFDEWYSLYTRKSDAPTQRTYRQRH